MTFTYKQRKKDMYHRCQSPCTTKRAFITTYKLAKE